MTAEQFRPKFTTSAKAAEERLERAEEEQGKNFHQRVRTVEGTQKPSRTRPVDISRRVTPAPEQKPLTDRQKRMLS